VVAAALAMLLVVGLVQVIAYQYVRGAVLAALERGVRAGSTVAAGVDECHGALADSLADVLGGEIRDSLEAECRLDGELILARASGTVPGWVGLGPDLGFEMEARAVREPEP
jgi:hypothetical protein